MLFCLGNVTHLLDVTPSNPQPYPLSPPPIPLCVIQVQPRILMAQSGRKSDGTARRSDGATSKSDRPEIHLSYLTFWLYYQTFRVCNWTLLLWQLIPLCHHCVPGFLGLGLGMLCIFMAGAIFSLNWIHRTLQNMVCVGCSVHAHYNLHKPHVKYIHIFVHFSYGRE